MAHPNLPTRRTTHVTEAPISPHCPFLDQKSSVATPFLVEAPYFARRGLPLQFEEILVCIWNVP